MNLTTPCTGDWCLTPDQQNAFYFSLGEACLGNLTAGFSTLDPPESVFDNGVCVPECGGRLVPFFQEMCLDNYAASSSHTNCFRTDGELGGRCVYSNPIAGANGAAAAMES